MINFVAIGISFVISVIFVYALIFVFRKNSLSQPILDLAPDSHQKKAGTPTMGGISFIVATTVAITLVLKVQSVNAIPVVGMLLFGLIGYIDDFMKVYLKRNMGLNSKQKLAFQFVFAIIIGYLLQKNGLSYIKIPFMNSNLELGILFYPFVIIFYTAMTNSTNMTDGLDGLLSHVTIIMSLFLIIVTYMLKEINLLNQVIIFLAAIVGFLIFNKYPAKIMMGDTGSMAIGGFLASIFFVTSTPIFAIFAGVIYVFESLSVILQVWSYKTRKKRIFLMSPVHHHYEKKGYSENKVVYLFTLIQFVGVLVALAIYVI